ncbi:MAG: hypothetical protein D6749_14255 [Chloroflexota bacterium]|nr:MAG: hypothetical protein D6749_14255 [Chloroflexota bacterium]
MAQPSAFSRYNLALQSSLRQPFRMDRRQFLIGAGLGLLFGSATVAVALGYSALFGLQIPALGLRLAPENFPTELRAALVFVGILGSVTWLTTGILLLWLRIPRRHVASRKSNAPPWYPGAPSIPHFTPPIPPPEPAYSNLQCPTRPTSQAHAPQPMPAHLERTQTPAMPPLLSYESLFPAEQTEPIVPPPSAEDDTPDSAPTEPPPQDA